MTALEMRDKIEAVGLEFVCDYTEYGIDDDPQLNATLELLRSLRRAFGDIGAKFIEALESAEENEE